MQATVQALLEEHVPALRVTHLGAARARWCRRRRNAFWGEGVKGGWCFVFNGVILTGCCLRPLQPGGPHSSLILYILVHPVLDPVLGDESDDVHSTIYSAQTGVRVQLGTSLT